MSTPVDIELKTESEYLFVSGTWFIGEIRLEFEELGEIVKEDSYMDLDAYDASDTWCYSCHRRPNESEDDIKLVELEENDSRHGIVMCNECKNLLQLHLREFIENNSCEISIQSL